MSAPSTSPDPSETSSQVLRGMLLLSALQHGKKPIGYDAQGGFRNQPLSGQTFTRQI
ncbi:MAG: hypothetical protein QF922_05740 [SAR324 cluster bacterium]|nr:hypothetical protein [SAR324 cluster bacterium]